MVACGVLHNLCGVWDGLQRTGRSVLGNRVFVKWSSLEGSWNDLSVRDYIALYYAHQLEGII